MNDNDQSLIEFKVLNVGFSLFFIFADILTFLLSLGQNDPKASAVWII